MTHSAPPASESHPTTTHESPVDDFAASPSSGEDVDAAALTVDPRARDADASVAEADDARECSICLEVVAASDRAVCCPRGHSYHQHCIKEWLCESKKDACPTCGAKITRRQVRLGSLAGP